MGINLTAACVVIIFDQDFNPHNDKQACDRAYRIGQKRDVEIIRFITKGTIEVRMVIPKRMWSLISPLGGHLSHRDDQDHA